MAKESEISSRKNSKIMKKNINKTISINGQLIISKTETGQEYVQFLPNNPVVGQVEPFRRLAHAQLLSNGVFDSLTKRRKRRGHPIFRASWASLSFAGDGYDYIIFKVPSAMRYMLHKILRSDINKIVNYLVKEGWSK
jgi:hypothetical protein